jgi:cupin fold WbuC family metalloprotein|tara:strand:- start:83 stop:517 length:435 start_codon:yes stop_codon:yes gene_type:complete
MDLLKETQLEKLMNKNIGNRKNIFYLSLNDLDKIKNTKNITGRSRYNLHKNFKSTIQEMLINFNKNSYVKPHYFIKKHTIFRLIKGSFRIKIYEQKKVRNIYLNQKNQMLIIKPKTMYDIISLQKNSIIHELMEGPFNNTVFKT